MEKAMGDSRLQHWFLKSTCGKTPHPKIEGVEIVSASWSPMLCILCKRLPASTEGSVSG